MAVDLAVYDAVARPTAPSTPVVLGWAGTAGGLRYLEALAPVLRALSERHAFVVRVISGGHGQVKLAGVPLDVQPWTAAGALSQLASFDVGLVPLDDTPFEQAKFPFKLLQFLALGVPLVSARVGTAAQVIEPDRNGLLAGTPAEWAAQLERLLVEPRLRATLGAGGRASVAERFTVERVGPLLVEGLRGALRSRPGGGDRGGYRA
jgi:glycosyltransferase involved in cell wall biosynthesis